MALEPEWEAEVEPHSCGVRPGRGTLDAIGGRATCYLGAVEAATLSKCDDLMEDLLMHRASQQHPNQERHWLLTHYWHHIGSEAGSFPHPKVSSCARTVQRPATKLLLARGAVMHFLSVAPRGAPHSASRSCPPKNAPKSHSKYPLKILPLEKACLFWLPMLHYKHSRLNRPLPA